jgi:hypothetical protein
LTVELLGKRGANTAIELLRDYMNLSLASNGLNPAKHMGLHAVTDDLSTLTLTGEWIEPVASEPIRVALADLSGDLSIVIGEHRLIECVAQL